MACVGAAWAGGLGATVGAGVGLFGVATQSHAQVVYSLQGAQLLDIADDGLTAIGYGSGRRAAMTWVAGGWVNRWGQDASIPGTRNLGYAISGDGSTYFGYVENGANMGMFRYRGPGTYQFIPNPAPNYLSVFTRASRSGDAAVGYAFDYTVPFAPHVAVRWTPQTGTVALGFGGDSDANDISADGNTIVGFGYAFGRGRAWRWTASGGTQQLQDLPGTGGFSSGAFAITGDGTVITGFSGADGDAVVWRNGIVESLGRIDGYHYAQGTSISDDASIIVGDIQGLGGGALSSTGFVWTRDHGMELIEQFFIRNGVVLPTDLSQSRLWRVAPSGTTLYLEGYGGYIVTIPAPATLAVLGALIPLSARRRRP